MIKKDIDITKMDELTDSQLFILLNDAAKINISDDLTLIGFQNSEVKLIKDLFKQAENNTLFLSELDDYPLCMLVVLLGEITRLDSNNGFRYRACDDEDILVMSASKIYKRIRPLLENVKPADKKSEDVRKLG